MAKALGNLVILLKSSTTKESPIENMIKAKIRGKRI
jgi:hypothetical protein